MRFGRMMIVAALGAVPGAATAQMFSGLVQNLTMQNVLWQPLRGSLAAGKRRAATAEAAGKSTPKGGKATATTTYAASPAVSARVRAEVVRAIGESSGADTARTVETAFQNGDPVAEWTAAVAASGLRPGDVADPFAAYWVLHWSIINRGEPTRAQVLAVRDQLRRTMLVNPSFTGLAPAGRQEMAEQLMIGFLIYQVGYRQARQAGDTALLDKLGEAAMTRAQAEFGGDLRRLALTDTGFVRR